MSSISTIRSQQSEDLWNVLEKLHAAVVQIDLQLKFMQVDKSNNKSYSTTDTRFNRLEQSKDDLLYAMSFIKSNGSGGLLT